SIRYSVFMSFSYLSLAPPHPPSFPTRRSSDLTAALRPARLPPRRRLAPSIRNSGTDSLTRETASSMPGACERSSENAKSLRRHRSEEHTSELQSPDHLVCRLLLEKKKGMNTRQ